MQRMSQGVDILMNNQKTKDKGQEHELNNYDNKSRSDHPDHLYRRFGYG